MYKSIAIISIICAFVLQGCVTVPIAKPGSVAAKQAASFAPDKNKAIVYIYRDSNDDYQAYALPVTFNKSEVQSAPLSYQRIAIKPNTKYMVQAHLEEPFAKENIINIDLPKGSIAFVELKTHKKAISRILAPMGDSASLVPTNGKEAIAMITHERLRALVPIDITNKH